MRRRQAVHSVGGLRFMVYGWRSRGTPVLELTFVSWVSNFAREIVPVRFESASCARPDDPAISLRLHGRWPPPSYTTGRLGRHPWGLPVPFHNMWRSQTSPAHAPGPPQGGTT